MAAKKTTIENFIKKALNIHGDRYDYSKFIYKGVYEKSIVICKKHGEFITSPRNHLSGMNCKKCMYEGERNVVNKLTIENFLERSKNIHKNKYDYSKVEYKNNKEKVIIICPNHGEFNQIAKDHLRGIGCFLCKDSKGEKIINIFLNEKKIKYVRQKKFDKCKNKNKLLFDFYLSEYNLCIEYDGEQHFNPVVFGKMSKEDSEICLKKTILNDKIKTNFCKENNINLLRIPYTEFKNIEKILEETLSF
jgi:very-short-patch-repair endonuclease